MIPMLFRLFLWKVEIFDQLFFEDTQFSMTASILVDLENGTVTLEEIKGVGY